MENFLAEIQQIINETRTNTVRSVNHALTVMYWYIGQRIVLEEQQGKERAGYGKKIVKILAEHLQKEYARLASLF